MKQVSCSAWASSYDSSSSVPSSDASSASAQGAQILLYNVGCDSQLKYFNLLIMGIQGLKNWKILGF